MEVSQDQLIGLGLNIVGFLAASGLLMIVSSAIRGRGSRKAAIVAAPVVPTGEPVPANSPSGQDNPEIEFVSLVARDTTETVETPAVEKSEPGGGITRRNRSEIIKMAREMLQARRSTEEITESLPVSEAELALLSQNNNASHGEYNG